MAVASSVTSIAGHLARKAAEIDNPSRDVTGGFFQAHGYHRDGQHT